MAKSQGFWSYVHDDDQADGGRIIRLAKDVVAQVEMLTGEPLALFLDKDAISWGDGWRNKIDASLASVAFFIPVMTPRYFMSPECRGELQFFARKATQLGIKELVLPLLYVDVPSLHDDDPADELIALVRTFQWEDWTDLRFVDLSGEGYRRGVARLASRLVAANRNIEIGAIAPVAEVDGSERALVDDEPGLIDLLATAEEALPKLSETMEAITQDVEQVGKLMGETVRETDLADKQGKGFGFRLLLVRKLARRLSQPADHLWSLGSQFASQLHEVDEGIRIIIQRAAVEALQDPDSKAEACEFFSSVRFVADSAREGLSSVQDMINSIGPLEEMSRDLRPVLRRLRQGLTAMMEAREVSEEWVRLIDASDLECEQESG